MKLTATNDLFASQQSLHCPCLSSSSSSSLPRRHGLHLPINFTRKNNSLSIVALSDPDPPSSTAFSRRAILLAPPLLSAAASFFLKPSLSLASEENSSATVNPPAEPASPPPAVTSPPPQPVNKEETITSRIYDATAIGEPMAMGKDKKKVWEKLMNARVVYLGEAEQVPTKDDKELELEILRNLRKRCLESSERQISVALEAFPLDLQEQLNQYMDKRIDGETLKSYVTDWPAQRWQEYEPLLTYCRDNAVRLIACGTPLKVLRTVQAEGIRGLSKSERKLYTPPAGSGFISGFSSFSRRSTFDMSLPTQIVPFGPGSYLYDHSQAKMVAGEVKRSEMMQNLFGDNSEEEEEEIDSEHESNPQPHYPSDEAEGGVEPGEEGEAEIEVHGEPEAESDGEQGVVEPGEGESEGEREESSQEGDVADPREESEEEEGDEERVATTRRRDVVESGSERSGERRYESEDEEVEQTRSPRSPSQEKEEAPVAQSDVNIRNVFGSSDDEDAEEYVRNDIEADEPRSPIEDEEGSEKDQRPDDMMLDDDMAPEEDPRYESEDERVEVRHRERPVGPPLEVEVPFRPPPGDPEKMNMIKVSSIMGIDPNPFDAKTFVEEDTFERDGEKTRIRLVNNIVRHRFVKGRGGKTYSESNARFVRWSDGSLQLLIGNEVLDITEQDARQDQNHLLLKHEKGILQSQGKILKKMRFIPSSLTSNSHRLLTALLDSREKKDFKVKNCVTDIDPEREKEKRERMESQNLKASTKLSQAREKIKRKYPLPVARRQLSTGYLEDALEEDEETDHYGSHRSNRGYEEDLEAEAQRERRIMNAKKKGFPGRSSMSSARPTRRQAEYSESEREESEYETEEEEEEEEMPRSRKRVKEPEDEYEEDAEEDDEEEDGKANRYSEEDEEAEAEKDRGSGRKRKGIESDEEESPPRKAPTHRRMAMVYDSDED